MADFHDHLAAVHGEIRATGTERTDALEIRLAALAGAALPPGVSRLPSARMAPGPHLAAQADRSVAGVASMEDHRGIGARKARLAAR